MKEEALSVNYAGTFIGVNQKSAHVTIYNIDELSPGFNFSEQHIIKLTPDKKIEWVTSRICDHANGTLEPCAEKNTALCPLHGWKLDLEKLHYTNVNVKKGTLNFDVSNNTINVEEYDTYLQLPDDLYKQQKEQEIDIRFIAHASLLFKCGDINIVTDPWLKGPCFLNAWWHKPAPSNDALKQLLNADLLYISHNHPDHMHEESLLYLYEHRPDIPIVIPDFKTKSTETPLKNIGFKNIIPLAFNQIFQVGKHKIFISILKSGDFRDDSGLYISYGKKQAVITVDSSALNHYHLPKNIDFLATSFAAGASGHPWTFDHYNHDKKLEITSKRHKSVKLSILKYILACKPRSYMPYAGYFSEDAPRDQFIKKNNKKNSPHDIKQLIEPEHPEIVFIDPTITDHIRIDSSIITSNTNIERADHIASETIDQYLSYENFPDIALFFQKLMEYFEHCKYTDELILYLIPCDCDFSQLDHGLIINFSGSCKPEKLTSDEINKRYETDAITQRQLLIKVRAKLLWQVINHQKSWEELSIGFHCRIHRKPDVYNSDFWYHFSNIYIK